MYFFSWSLNEDALLAALATGPVSAAVDATTWNNYMGGIIQFHCGSAGLNHAVEIVGYDKTGENSYFLRKRIILEIINDLNLKSWPTKD